MGIVGELLNEECWKHGTATISLRKLYESCKTEYPKAAFDYTKGLTPFEKSIILKGNRKSKPKEKEKKKNV